MMAPSPGARNKVAGDLGWAPVDGEKAKRVAEIAEVSGIAPGWKVARAAGFIPARIANQADSEVV
jgi:hypothetical protein